MDGSWGMGTFLTCGGIPSQLLAAGKWMGWVWVGPFGGPLGTRPIFLHEVLVLGIRDPPGTLKPTSF